MVNKRCSKNFPKIFNDETAVDSNGFPVYKRRDNGQYVVKSDIPMDNRTVVPYNKTLLKKFQAHVNVEWCNKDGSIKYLFKYINKGPDRATISLVQNNNGDNQDPNLDEIKAFYDCRYVSACEAAWRIFGFDVHFDLAQVVYDDLAADDVEVEDEEGGKGTKRFPSVMRLAFHLPGEQQTYDLAKTLTYAELLTRYVWKKQCRKWEPQQKGFAIGRVHVVPAAFDEAYYLRILLNKVKGPQCFEDIRIFDGFVCETFRDACYKRGLLDDDKEYIEAIEEASHTSS
ncbi:uncharacterized protein LOC143563076 [Bidens hawaiensis]|uniref:uncharacterized protein LOC143563076 n=1 Tax=Bidens hawaiensis TaxID=980011 RepID=UPI00404AE60A